MNGKEELQTRKWTWKKRPSVKTQVRNALPRGKVVRNSTMLLRKTKQKKQGNKDGNRKQPEIQLEIARKKSESLQESDKNREEPKKTAD